ncbi:hypothetical protein A9Q99_00150 [Gammaproteobacteria bacterium 45_16_T64]|nr:hypothetical protein A9Q99_00150 [Gammaproteobacteria bacterium 45_16_T64]
MKSSIRPTPINALASLTAAALALPAISTEVIADTSPYEFSMSYQATHYQEDNVDDSAVYSGDSERYTIDIQQFRVVAPINSALAVILNIQDETLSGASPWYVDKEANPDKPVVMSGASIKEHRTDASIQTTYYHDNGSLGLTAGISEENDYASSSLGLGASFNFNDKLSTLSVGVSGSNDSIEPTQGNVPTNTIKDDKQSSSAFVGLSQVINKDTIIQVGSSFASAEGFLSDSYKLNDRRPDSRQRWTVNTALRQHYSSIDSTLHLDYRYYGDDWEMQSHTVDASVWVELGDHVMLIPSVRWYSQSDTPFFANTADSANKYHSSDYRLSSYGAITTGLRAQCKYGDWLIAGTAERYESGKELGIFDGDESPVLVEFTRVSMSIDYTF